MPGIDRYTEFKREKNGFLKALLTFFIISLAAAVCTAGMLTADSNIRCMAFSSAQPVVSVNTEAGDVSLNILDKEVKFSAENREQFLNRAEKWRALIPAELRIYAETAVWVCAEISSFM